jgi:hypothetical protein
MALTFNWRGNVEMIFRGSPGVQRAAPNRMRWSVYAFRFSQLEGQSVYVDNAASKTSNLELTEPLLAFRGASLGVLQGRHFTRIVSAGLDLDDCHRYPFSAESHAGIDIAFIEAFTVAASDTQIGERMDALASRFGIF